MVVLSALVASACGGDREMPGLSSAPVADQIIAATSQGPISDTVFDSPVETTPLTAYVIDGAERPNPVSDLFVIGTVLQVAGGFGYSWPGGPQIEGGETTEVVHPFNNKDAWISTVHLIVSVETALYRDEAFADKEQVAIGLALLSPVDLEALNDELVGQKIAAPLLANERTFFRKEPGVYGVLLSGELLGFVGDDGIVAFPALRRLPSPSGGLHEVSLDDLLNPPEVISVRKVGEHYFRDS